MSFDGSKAVLLKDLSGNIVSISSGALQVVGSLTANVSGNPVALVQGSGQNGVFITNQSGTLFTPLDASGRIAVTHSGDVISLTSGLNYVSTTSGSVVNLGSPTAVASVSQHGSNDTTSTATNDLLTADMMKAYDPTAAQWVRVRVTVSGSPQSQGGTQYRILTDTTQAGAVVRRNDTIAAISNSGGSSLGSGVVIHGIKLKNLTSGEGAIISGTVWVGGSGTNLAPFSGFGYPLNVGESLELKTINFNSVRVVAAISGSLISAIGVDF